MMLHLDAEYTETGREVETLKSGTMTKTGDKEDSGFLLAERCFSLVLLALRY